MYRIVALIFLAFAINSCQTPEVALKNGYYKMAIQLASNEIRKGKNTEFNKKILQISAEEFVKKEINETHQELNSPDVKKWKRIQDQLYLNLEVIGNANINSGYLITEHYNDLCTYKKDIDFKIVDYYYQNGMTEMKALDKTGMKENARKAYYFFANAEKNGGNIYYNDISLLLNEALEKGIVYYRCHDFDLGSSRFIKPLPPDDGFLPDCEVSVHEGFISFSESKSENVTNYEKEIQIETRTETDTSGHVKIIPVFETKKAKLIKTTFKLCASQTIWINVIDKSGQCNLRDNSFAETAEETYEEIKAEGDKEVIDISYIEGSNEPIFLKSHLEDEIRDKVRIKLRNFY
ncbi:MAG: hypothetical protein IPH57_18480 [Saprospiraceae bacterium]|nr:hypothetical protein [Saprospiraceae bacterium]